MSDVAIFLLSMGIDLILLFLSVYFVSIFGSSIIE